MAEFDRGQWEQNAAERNAMEWSEDRFSPKIKRDLDRWEGREVNNVDNLIEEWAKKAQNIYDGQTAGDYTWVGFLAEYTRAFKALAQEGEESDSSPACEWCGENVSSDEVTISLGQRRVVLCEKCMELCAECGCERAFSSECPGFYCEQHCECDE